MSSGSESDEEYVPEEPEKVSEEESADEETNVQYEKEQKQRSVKRKTKQTRNSTKKIKVKNGNKEIEEEDVGNVDKTEMVANPEEEKKREEDLWAKFLEGTDTKPKSRVDNCSNATHLQTPTTSSKIVTATKSTKPKVDDNKEREKRIFEFAGETIVVENNVIKEKIKSTDSATLVNKNVGPSRGHGAGLANVLGQLNKKNKLSTLEKSKLDWVTYKKEEGFEDEIQSHNKGKDGYLERQDFLERADLRQYEIERDLRMKRRSNR